MPAPYAHGLITFAVATIDQIVIAGDCGADADLVDASSSNPCHAFELAPGFVVAGSGIWKTADRQLDFQRDAAAAYRQGDDPETFLHRYDRLHRQLIEKFLTRRFREAPDAVLRECFCPLMPPQSIVACRATATHRRLTILEYIPTLTNEDHIVLTPLLQTRDAAGDDIAFAAIGAAAPFIDLLDREYIEHAIRGPRGPQRAAKALIVQAISRTSSSSIPPSVLAFPIAEEPRSSSGQRDGGRPTEPVAAAAAIGIDTKSVASVEKLVQEHFAVLFPGHETSRIHTVFRDIDDFFAGRDPDYAAIDLRYHDLEHTLQATACLAHLLTGRHAARATPRIDAHHFQLAIVAALLHDTGYLKLRSDSEGTGAKYTFCHVLRSCAFAASYLPRIGASASDVETVLSAINCTGPMNEVSRLRFQAPVDEIIGCGVATADYLGQMAAPEYPDELDTLYHEFEESDDFLHLPVEHRMFKSSYDLTARTPQFWHRYVLPKLESEFRGVYRFLAKPYPDGTNSYLVGAEANIAEVQRRLREAPPPRLASGDSNQPFGEPRVPASDATPPDLIAPQGLSE